MKHLPDKINMSDLALELSQTETKSIDIRRKMMQLPEICNCLSNVDKYVFVASTKTQIQEIDKQTLLETSSQMFRYIAIDVGYNIPNDENEWAYIKTRLVDILQRYFGTLTLSDIKLAFELTTSGELDDYLPRDSHGNVDKEHYQQFNADYISKILRAYIKKQNEVFEKAYKALPTGKPNISEEQVRNNDKRVEERKRKLFLRYKYSGRVVFELCDEMFVYDWLMKCGLADDVNVSIADRKKAYSIYMQRISNGLINKYTAYAVRKKGIASPEIDYTAYEVARHKEIIRAFDRMIAEEMQVDNYLKFV